MNRKKIYAMILTASMLAASACGSSTEPAAADASAENTGSRIDGGNADIHCAGDFHSE